VPTPRRLARSLLPICLFAVGSSSRASAQEELRILVIHGTVDLSVWEQSFNEAFYRTVAVDPDVRVTLEFLAPQIPTAEHGLVAEAVRRRISATPMQLVIAVQAVAGMFLYEWGDVFAPGVPRLYVLPTGELSRTVRAEQSGTVLESGVAAAARETALMIPRLLPRLERIYVAGGASSGDSSYLARARSAIDAVELPVPVTYLPGQYPESLIEVLRDASENAAVILGTFDGDPLRPLRTTDVAERLNANVDVPLFGLFDSVLGRGAVGGSITSSSLYGRKTADIARAMLGGDSTTDLSTPPTTFVFDGAQLSRFGIARGRLPEGAEIINDVRPDWQRYFAQIAIGAVVILAQALLILALLRSLRRQRNAERERDQQSIRRENQVRLFESVTNAMTDAFVIVDLDGHIVAGNEAGFRTTFGCPIQRAVGRPFGELFDATETTGKCVTKALSMEPAIRSFRRCGTIPFPGEVLGCEISDVNGVRTGHWALIRDVTERLRREDALRQAHKMEALGNLAGGIAHDFNNILMAIAGSAEIAEMSLDDAETVRTQLANVLTASDRAKGLIGQILMFSRRGEDDTLGPVDLAALLEESVALLHASLPKTVTMDLSVGEDLHDVTANAMQLQRAVMNLCANSAYAMHEEGTIVISARNLTVHSHLQLLKQVVPPGDYVVLSVADTGDGIDPELLGRVFEPFFTTKPVGKGTGMGLAMVYGMARSHGAYLDLMSEPGVGTTVTLYLRPSSDAAAAPAKRAAPMLRAGEGRVLLVDDEALVAATTGRILEHLGYSVTSFTRPKEALAAFEADPHQFDLVISDQSMPELDGVALLGTVAAMRPDIPTILCTGYLDAVKRAGLPAPKFAVLNKPCSVAAISAAVSGALAGAPTGEQALVGVMQD